MSISDLLFFFALFGVALFPLTLRRTAALALCVLIFAGMGAGFSHLYTERFLSGAEEGRYEVSGTVTEFSARTGYTKAVLSDLTFDGEPFGGKLHLTVSSEDVCVGDILVFTANVTRCAAGDGVAAADFTEDIRYAANAAEAEKTGESGNLLLRLNAHLYRTLRGNMPEEEGELAYALLTGNPSMMDDGLLRSVQRGGIAHIFAVSGLHIGILYGAVSLLFSPLRRLSAIPAWSVAMCYAAFCGFSVSALRAVVMCGVHALCVFFGRKYDLTEAIAAAALLLLVIFPADWLSAGFRLSFGACLGLALFSGMFSRGMKRLHCPAFLANFFAAGLSVQCFTFPILLESFGYVSVWGYLLNLVLIPALPAFFLGILLPAVLSLAVAPLAGVFLVIPRGLCAALIALMSRLDVSLVLTGFSLGAGAVVWFTACVMLSGHFRAAPCLRLSLAGAFSLLFALTVVLRNVVFTGAVVTVKRNGDEICALVRTPECSVLLLGDAMGTQSCMNFLSRELAGAPDAVFIVAEDEVRALNVAAFLGAGAVYAMRETSTGLRLADPVFTGELTVGGLTFRYEAQSKLVLFAEGCVIEFDFASHAVLAADFSVERGETDLKFYVNDGIIKMI